MSSKGRGFIEILFFLVSLIASTIGAISGIGGGVIIKPVLDATGAMSVSTVSFLSGCTVLSMACVSLTTKNLIAKKSGSEVKINKKTSTPLAIGAALGGWLGKSIFDIVKSLFSNEDYVGAIQGIMLFIITAGVFIYIKKKSQIKTHSVTNIIVCFIIGLLLGLISAFLGIGGGPINIAVLYFFFSMDAKTAALNSIYIILFSQTVSFLSTVFTNKIPTFPLLVLMLMVIGGVLGGLLGSNIAKKLNAKRTEQVFTVLLFVIMGVNVFNIVKFLT